MTLFKFEKNFYQESSIVTQRSPLDIQQFLSNNQITIQGNAPRPIFHFNEVNFPGKFFSKKHSFSFLSCLEPVMEMIVQCGFEKPTLIQSCAWPILLSGLDLIGIALTGSGKTLAFILPALIHASHQEFVQPGDSPIVLVMAPTRELVQQIYTVTHQFGQLAQCRTAVIFGGAAKEPQRNILASGL